MFLDRRALRHPGGGLLVAGTPRPARAFWRRSHAQEQLCPILLPSKSDSGLTRFGKRRDGLKAANRNSGMKPNANCKIAALVTIPTKGPKTSPSGRRSGQDAARYSNAFWQLLI